MVVGGMVKGWQGQLNSLAAHNQFRLLTAFG